MNYSENEYKSSILHLKEGSVRTETLGFPGRLCYYATATGS